jgi:hypothetical protein
VRHFFVLIARSEAVTNIDQDDIVDFYIIADYFDFNAATNHITSLFCKNCLDAENANQLMEIGRLFPALGVHVNHFIAENFEHVIEKSHRFPQNLLLEELTQIINSPEFYVSREIILWNSICSWVREDTFNRKHSLADLVLNVRLGLMKRTEFLQVLDDYTKLHARTRKLKHPEVFDKITAFQDWKHSFIGKIPTNSPEPEIPPKMKRIRIPKDFIICSGGWTDALNPSANMELYDHNYGAVMRLPVDLPGPRAHHGTAVLNNKMYCIGGYDLHAFLRGVQRLDLNTLTWEEVAPMHEARCNATACIVNGEIYAIGGWNEVINENSCERYNPILDRWFRVPSMQHPRRRPSAVVVDGAIWIIGGSTGDTFTNSVCPFFFFTIVQIQF